MDLGSSPLHIETDYDGSILLRGELDMATVKQLEQAIAEFVRPGRTVVIDMAQLRFIDSSGIGLLVSAYQQTGERVVICNPSHQVRRVLELMDGRATPGAWAIQD